MGADYDQQVYQKLQVRRAVLAFMSVLEKDKQVSRALSTAKKNCRYNQEKERWEPINVEALYSESNKARRNFLQSMEQYDAVAKPKYQTNLSIRDAHSWDEVQRAIDAKTSGFWGRIRLGFRKFSNSDGSCCAFLELIPSSSLFTATLCGALKLIFVAAQRIGNVRKEVMDALESFPDTLSKIPAALSIFYESEDMHRRISALYVSILDALEGILTWFKERAASKPAKAFWKQVNYKEDLLEIQRIARENNAVAAQQSNLLNKVQASLEDQMKDARASVIKARRPQKASIKPGTILEQLSYEPGLYEQDLTSCLRIIRDLPLAEEHRAATIFQHQRLIAWLTTPVSDLVVMNGNGENTPRSAKSYVCAQLILSLVSSEDPFIPIYFFCGEHINWRKDHNAHPVSLIHGLIGQLLSQWSPAKISFVKGLSDKLQSDEPLELCLVFSSLISQLPDTAIVVCVIGAISYFEDKERRDAICTIVRSLSKVAKLDEGPLFKVLLTSPFTCRHITHYVDKADIINIPAVCPSQAGYRQVAI
ncbi:hypothetical protein BJX62DRAFT_233830 [Aspergillus germanicus]